MNKKRGFTLIELVVVIAILGILAGIAIPRFMRANAAARGAKVLGDLRAIDSAINLYSTQNGVMPTALSQLTQGESPLIVVKAEAGGEEFSVVQNNGKEGLYNDVSAGEDYKINSEGRATFGGSNRTVEWYLAGSSSEYDVVRQALEAMIGDSNSVIREYFAQKNNKAGSRIDSEGVYKAGNTEKTWREKVTDALTAAGVDSSKVSWTVRMSSDGQTIALYMTERKLTIDDIGKTVSVSEYKNGVLQATVERSIQNGSNESGGSGYPQIKI